MYHLVVGDEVFSVQDHTPISRLAHTDCGPYSETSLIDNADSEITGLALSKLSLAATWTRPKAAGAVNRLRKLLSAPQQVSDGYNLGRWTISSIEEVKTSLVHNGKAMKTEVNIQFLEKRGASTS
ncbi:phage tail protein [Vibrio coralliilyticus]|uniref:phage tail protein n=1 Tax=Vibrio coralliilyticus TaxID=190893 RepID=UPI00155F87A6|nr:phage tail protein [Vibrio coralliilyticus]NRF63617.1 phage tail protein [Vibrio coralliilyticus]